MIGSTIVYIPELPKDKSDLFDRIMENEEFEKIELDGLTTLDFSIINMKANTKWQKEKNPIVFDEDIGLVIIHISESGLNSVINYKGELENVDTETQEADILALKKFVNKHGSESLYELVTF